jgi:predicted SnoaL-like aldol condensation-catalyzing enzyme
MTTANLRDLADGFAAALNDHDVDALQALIHPGYINHNPYVPAVPGPDSAVSFFSDWLAAFPDAEVICEDTVAVGTLSEGTVVGRYTYLGTFTNPIFGIAPTGKQTVMRSIDIWRVRDGRLAEHWDELNSADWFAQLQGAEPQPRTGAAQARTTAGDTARPTHLITGAGKEAS